MKSLKIVLKTVERCNLNCSYCYFFNGLDQSYSKRPKFITKDTIDNLASFIRQGIQDLEISDISIVLHGGEPLMQPKEDFVYLISTLQKVVSAASLSFSVQTNATLVTPKWIDLLNLYNVGVGVSIDGPLEYNDKYRVDHRGHGSYNLVVRGIRLLQEGLSEIPGCLTVINPEFDGAIIYRHLVDLGFKSLDFLFPDNNHHVPPPYPINRYTKFLIDVFDAWTKDNRAEVSIRKFKSIILQLLGEKPLIYGFGHGNEKNIPLLAIRSDGSISPTDELMSTDPNTVTLTDKNIRSSTLREVIGHQIFNEIAKSHKEVPDKCSKCCWYGACGGGSLVSRFSKDKRFNNHSVYCEALQEIFTHITAYLINSGVSQQIITNNLFKRRIL